MSSDSLEQLTKLHAKQFALLAEPFVDEKVLSHTLSKLWIEANRYSSPTLRQEGILRELLGHIQNDPQVYGVYSRSHKTFSDWVSASWP